jgi:uncharacterized protein (DUF58 family)
MEDQSFFRRVRQIELVAAKLVDQLLGGRYRSIFRGQGIEFDEVREYVAGDDVRTIDWNVTSRMGLPHTKIFREEREIILFIVVDISASLFAGSGEIGKNEYAAHVFAILSLAAVTNNDRVGAAFFSDRIEKWISPAKGRKHILSLIHELLKTKPRGTGSDLDLALKGVYRNLKRRGICFIISDFRTEGYWDSLSLLARKHDCVAVKIADPVDTVFPRVGIIELEDPESTEVMFADGRSASFRQSYERYWQEKQAVWESACARRGVDTLTLNTSDDPGVEILRFFRRRRRAS